MSSFVIVGTDGSTRASLAVETAAGEAARRGIGLRLVYGYAPLYGFTGLDPTPDADVLEACELLLEDAARAASRKYPDLVVEKKVVVNDPAFALVSESSEPDVELVVVGARGISAMRRLLMGSVSTKVATYAEKPVIVVRGAPGKADGPVTVGIAPENGSPNALDFAFQEAKQRSVPVRVIQAQQHAGSNYGSLVDETRRELVMAQVKASEERTKARFEEVKAQYPGVPATLEISSAHAIDVLVDAAADASLIVVGSSGKNTLKVALLGSVSMGVLHAAPMVAVVRENVED